MSHCTIFDDTPGSAPSTPYGRLIRSWLQLLRWKR